MADSIVTGDGWLQRVGIAFDEFVNVVLLNGDPHETVSLHAAIAARDGKRWGCVFCRVLDYLVEMGHCTKQFDTSPTGALAAVRSAVAFAFAVMLVLGLFKLLALGVHLLFI